MRNDIASKAIDPNKISTERRVGLALETDDIFLACELKKLDDVVYTVFKIIVRTTVAQFSWGGCLL